MAVRAGWARREITPPLGARLRGYFHERRADAVHDPLWAKALYLTDGTEEVAFVAVDLCCIGVATVAAARQAAARTCGLAPERLVVHATHTHLAPLYEDHGPAIAAAIAEAVAGARASAAPATGRAGYGHEETVAFCRRFVMRDGTVRTNPGRRNPDILCPTAPIDPEIGLLELSAAGRRLIVVNYALHLDTIGGMAISADWPYYLELALREAFGDQVETLFVQGCSGDINHIDVASDLAPTGFAMAESIGRRLAEAVRSALDGLMTIDLDPLAFARRELTIDLPQPASDALAAARALWEGADRSLTRELVRAGVVCERAARGPRMAVEISALRLGGVGWVALPGELFGEYGRRLKQWSPFEVQLCAELSHDDIVYVPTPEGAVAGGYESWNMLTPPGTGDRMVAAAAELLQRI